MLERAVGQVGLDQTGRRQAIGGWSMHELSANRFCDMPRAIISEAHSLRHVAARAGTPDVHGCAGEKP
jgi:hypothetical protein